MKLYTSMTHNVPYVFWLILNKKTYHHDDLKELFAIRVCCANIKAVFSFKGNNGSN